MKRTQTDIPRASKEQVLSAAKLGSANQVRFLVSNFYMAQEMRKRADMQLRHLGDKDDPMDLLKYWGDRQADIEKDTHKMLEVFAESRPIGRWMLAQDGVGPIIAAGLLAHLDITRAPTAGHIWRFAGLDPRCEWYGTEKAAKIVSEMFPGKKKLDKDDVMAVASYTKRNVDTLMKFAAFDREGNPQELTSRSLSAALAKRPYCAQVKQILFHFGTCVKKRHNMPLCFYGKLYAQRKAQVVARNFAGEYAERAKTFYTKSAEVKKILAQGKLPPGNLDSQAMNHASKIFTSHLHALMHWDHYGQPPRKPFAIEILGHGDEIMIPDHEMFPGFFEAYYGRSPKR